MTKTAFKSIYMLQKLRFSFFKLFNSLTVSINNVLIKPYLHAVIQIIFIILIGNICYTAASDEITLQNVLYKQLNSRVLHASRDNKDFKKVLSRLFGKDRNCDAKLFQPNGKLRELKSISACHNCRLAINTQGIIHGIKELNWEGENFFNIIVLCKPR